MELVDSLDSLDSLDLLGFFLGPFLGLLLLGLRDLIVLIIVMEIFTSIPKRGGFLPRKDFSYQTTQARVHADVLQDPRAEALVQVHGHVVGRGDAPGDESLHLVHVLAGQNGKARVELARDEFQDVGAPLVEPQPPTFVGVFLFFPWSRRG